MRVNAQKYESNSRVTQPSPDQNINFRLFETHHEYMFLKLDTRSGRITRVDLLGDFKVEMPVNPKPLVDESERKPGRFFLYYTKLGDELSDEYILIDQISGQCWQVIWNLVEPKILPVF